MDSAVPRGPDRRKEWRAVPQEPEHGKHGHSDERTIYEEGAGPLQVDYCSITIDGGDDMLRERLQEIARQQQELHQIEVGLRAHAMARSEFAGMQNEYEARVKEHADAAAALKEQLHERERQLRDMGAKLDEKDRELRAVKIDNEAAWAKEDLLREQNKELATYRRERDNSEAERAQHLQKIHELQEHVQEKESQFLALEEQHRVAQETILFKDEQLREAQTWIARAQEMDALHSTTNQSLQAELRDRTEQFNQYWIGLQRQFAEVERHHLQAIQQLQLELAEAREHNGVYKEGSHVTRDKGSPVNANGGAVSNGNLCFMSNGNADAAPSFVSATSASSKAEHVSAVSVPSSVLGVGTFLPPAQMTAVHTIAMHTHGTQPSVPLVNLPNPQSHMAHLLPVSAVQHWSNEHALPDASQVTNQNKHLPSQTEQHHLRSNAQNSYPNSAERQAEHSENPKSSINNQLQRSGPVISSSNDGVQILESTADQYQQVPQESHETSKLQPQALLVCNPPKQKSDLKVQDENLAAASNQAQEKVFPSSQQQTAVSIASSTAESHPVSSLKVADHIDIKQISGLSVPGKAVEPTLLDERSLLACIVRAIPAGSDGRIRISSTLPNRLGKMLAPLHWHDYKKFYGKLDDFVALHLELFVIEGDFIHLREGAQEIISATTAYAKVAAAAASSAPYPSLLPSVAVTPVAQNNRHKKAQPADSMSASTVLPTEITSVPGPVTSHVRRSHNVKLHNQQATNSVTINTVQTKDMQEPNGISQVKSGPSLHKTLGNGSNLDNEKEKTEPALSFGAMPPSQNNGMTNGRHGFGGRQQGRSSAAGLISRRQN